MKKRRPRMLHCDDEQGFGQVLLYEFHEMGYDTFYIPEKEAALIWAVSNHPEAVITDIRSPKMGGLEFLSRIKADARTSAAKVFMYTGSSSLETAVEAKRRGAEDFISKPATIDDLTKAVGSAVPSPAPTRSGQSIYIRGVVPEGYSISIDAILHVDNPPRLVAQLQTELDSVVMFFEDSLELLGDRSCRSQVRNLPRLFNGWTEEAGEYRVVVSPRYLALGYTESPQQSFPEFGDIHTLVGKAIRDFQTTGGTTADEGSEEEEGPEEEGPEDEDEAGDQE